MNSPRRKIDPPRASLVDSITIRKIPHPFGSEETGNKAIMEKIVDAVNRMGGVGEDAEANYQAALEGLRRDAKGIITHVARLYRGLPKTQYLDRWSLVQLLADLGDPASLEVLDEILSSRIPPEESKKPGTYSTVGREVFIRTTAVEAATRLAASGNVHAVELLLKYTQHDNFSVRRAAIQSYLSHGGVKARQVLLQRLPKEDHYILDISRLDVRKAPQPKVGEYRAKPDRNLLPPLGRQRGKK